MTTKTQEMHVLVIKRVFDATRDQLWHVWTEPDLLKMWWGPKDFSVPHLKMDFRAGGKYLSCMRSPEGKEYWNTGVYEEIAKPVRLVMTDSFADANGTVVPASYYGMEGDFPLELRVTITFEEQDTKTKMTLEHAGMPAGDASDGARVGWNESFDKLDKVLKGVVAESTSK